MLQAYNVLFPFEYGAIGEDEYMTAMASRIGSHQSIINANITGAKSGSLILPCTIHDVDASSFEFRDGLDRVISTLITKVNTGNGWIDVSYEGPIDNTDSLYAERGTVIFVQFNLEPVLFNKTLTGDLATDGKMFSLTYYERLEFLYNSRLGCKYVSQDEQILSFDLITGIIETDFGTYTLDFPAAVTMSVGDTIPSGTFIDKAVSLVLEPPYVKVVLKKEYSYIKRIFTFDSNKIIELID